MHNLYSITFGQKCLQIDGDWFAVGFYQHTDDIGPDLVVEYACPKVAIRDVTDDVRAFALKSYRAETYLV